MFRSLQSYCLKNPFVLISLLMLLLFFELFPDEAQGEEILLTVSERHKRVGEILEKKLQPKIPIKLSVVSLKELVNTVLESDTDFFVISISEIAYIKSQYRKNLAVKGQAIGSSDIAEKIHLTTVVKTGIKDIGDLDDKLPEKPVSIGPKKSSTEAHANCSMEAQRRVKGPQDFKCGGSFKCQYDDFDVQADKLIKEEIKAYYVTGEVPIPSVEEVAETNQLILATIPGEIVKDMNRCSLNDKFVPTIINMNDYHSGDTKVSTAGIPLPVAATDKAKENTVRMVTIELVKENPFISVKDLPPALKAIHSFMEFHPVSLAVFKKCGIIWKD